MEKNQIDIILSIAKCRSFSEAAEENFVSISTVSKQVSAVETELGVRLYERRGKSRVFLTEKG